MSNKDNKKQKKQRKWIESCERRSDRRTAEYLAKELDDLQERMCDLIADIRTFEHYSEVEDVGWCLMLMQRLKKKYRKFAEDGAWPETP